MTERACQNCKWWVLDETRQFADLGQCKRHPPTADIQHLLCLGVWPATNYLNWCGEFQEKGEVE